MTWFEQYNSRALAEGFFNDAEPYGVSVVRQEPNEQGVKWAIIGVHHLTPDENRGGHQLYVEMLDEQGQRVQPVGWLTYTWDGIQEHELPTPPIRADKPDHEPKGHLGVWANQTIHLRCHGTSYDANQPDADGGSDWISGVHTRHADEGVEGGPRNTYGHHSFYVIYQRKVDEPPPPPLQAEFSAAPTSGPAPLAVQFTDASQGDPTGYEWFWSYPGSPDRTLFSTERNPPLTFDEPGKYSITLRVQRNADTSELSKPSYITVTEREEPQPEAGKVTVYTDPAEYPNIDRSDPATWPQVHSGGSLIAKRPDGTHLTFMVELAGTNWKPGDGFLEVYYVPERPD